MVRYVSFNNTWKRRTTNFDGQPTAFEMKKKNEKFANDSRSGKKPTHLSRQERLAKRSPVGLWALGIIIFVVCGGGMFLFTNSTEVCIIIIGTVVFELVRIMFL